MIFTVTARRPPLWVLKFVGIILFLLIISQIDWAVLAFHLRKTNLPLLLAAFPVLLLTYVWKTARWHALVQSLGLQVTVRESWQVYNIGTFLGIITPAKVGEFSRAAYVRSAGLSGARSLGAVVVDRIADVIVIGLLAVVAAGILFGKQWIGIGIVIALFLLLLVKKLFPFARFPLPNVLPLILLWTLASWATYFTWAMLVAYAIGITVAPTILISVFTLTGIIALIPIAPSGLGTRDAALITLLAPYGIPPEQAVALAFLMFISIIASSLIGGYYWIRR